MKNYKEMADSVFQRSNEILAERAKRRRTISKILFQVGCCCLVALIGFGIWKSGILDQTPITLTGDNSSSEGNTTLIGSTESSKNHSDNNSAYTSVPSNQSEQTELQGNTSSEQSDSNESQENTSSEQSGSNGSQENTASNTNSENESQATISSSDGNVHAVYRTIPATYEEAKRLFGHPIVECSSKGFLGYEIAAITPNGNIQNSNIIYLSVIYLFQNGKVELVDQSRLGPGVSIGYDSYPLAEYKNHTFWYDSVNNNIYFPLSDNMVLTANFSDVELSETYDLLLTLGGKN